VDVDFLHVLPECLVARLHGDPSPHGDVLFLAYPMLTSHRPRFGGRRPGYGVAFYSAARVLHYALRNDEVRYIYVLPTARCQLVDASSSPFVLPGAFTTAVEQGAALVNVRSLPAQHELSHVASLHIAALRPLALPADDPLQVNVNLVGGISLSINVLCGTAEWMGQVVSLHDSGEVPSLRIVCDASLQTQVHPHLLHTYLAQTAPTTADAGASPRPWSVTRDLARQARQASLQVPGSLIWVFLYQSLSASDAGSNRRWALASLTEQSDRAVWVLRYQSARSRRQHVIVYREHMAHAPLPDLLPMDDRYTFEWNDPLIAVWFPAVQSASSLYSPPPCLDPVSYVIATVRRARDARLCAPPRLWKDLPHFHGIREGITHPVSGLVIDFIDTFSRFHSASFPCAPDDSAYGGIGSTFAVLERGLALDYALAHDAFLGMSDDSTMDCACVSDTQGATPPCSMALPGFLPQIWSQVAAALPHFHHDSWEVTDPAAWLSDPPPSGPPFRCPCGAGFDTLARLQWHVNGPHPAGSQHSSALRLLPRMGGAYIVHDLATRAVRLCQ
jgi:hypothetical protein